MISMNLFTLFIILAMLCFLFAFIAPFFNINTGRAKFVALGLFFMAAARLALGAQ